MLNRLNQPKDKMIVFYFFNKHSGFVHPGAYLNLIKRIFVISLNFLN